MIEDEKLCRLLYAWNVFIYIVQGIQLQKHKERNSLNDRAVILLGRILGLWRRRFSEEDSAHNNIVDKRFSKGLQCKTHKWG